MAGDYTGNPFEAFDLIDLSATLANDRSWAPWWARTRVSYQSHNFGAHVMRWLFGVPRRLMETGLGWANEDLKMSTHGTTHVDAPWHYGPMCGDQRARTIDEMPLEWFVARGFVLDFRSHLEDDRLIELDDVTAATKRIEHEIRAGDIAIIRTGCEALWGSREYFERGPGVSAAATEWLIEHGVRVMGIDAWGWDGPMAPQTRRARAANRPGVFWAAHYVGTRMEYCQIERLMGLDQLPSTGFYISAFPLKVKSGSAGPARVVAFVPKREVS